MCAIAGSHPDVIAKQILDLVNSRPKTPNLEEIAAVIAMALGQSTAPPLDMPGLDEYGPDLRTPRSSLKFTATRASTGSRPAF